MHVFRFFIDFRFFMDFDNVRNAKTKQKTMHARKGKGKRDLPACCLKMEVLDPLPCCRCCLSDFGHMPSHFCKTVPTEPKGWETEEMGQPKEPEMKSSRCDQEDPSRRKRS